MTEPNNPNVPGREFTREEAEENLLQHNLAEMAEREIAGKSIDISKIPYAMLDGWRKFWYGEPPSAIHGPVMPGKDRRATMALTERGYRAAYRSACAKKLAPIRFGDARRGMTYGRNGEGIVQVLREPGTDAVTLVRDGNMPDVTRSVNAVMWTSWLPDGLVPLHPPLGPNVADLDPIADWPGLLPPSPSAKNQSAPKKKTTMTEDLQMRDESKGAGDREKSREPEVSRQVPLDPPLVDTWTPVGDRAGLCHLVSQYVAHQGHDLSTRLPSNISDVFDNTSLRNWALNGVLPVKVTLDEIAGFLRLTRATVARAMLWQWLNEVRDLDAHPFAAKDDVGAMLFYGMVARGDWFPDVEAATGIADARLRIYIARGERVKGRNQERIGKYLGNHRMPSWSAQPEPIVEDRGMPEAMARRDRRAAFAKSSPQSAKVVPFKVAAPAAPQRPVAVDLAKGPDSTASVVVAKSTLLLDINAWHKLGEALGRRAITGLSYTEAGNIQITGPCLLGGSIICTSADDAITRLREALAREQQRQNGIVALMATLSE